MKKLNWLVIASVAGLAMGGGGCAGMREIEQGRIYPTGLKRGTTLDIQVIRRSTRIELTNTTARPFGESILWLNGRFSKQIDGLAVGERLEFALKEFKDEFGEPFRGGGFFATVRTDMLALAEIQPVGSDEILALVVVRGDE